MGSQKRVGVNNLISEKYSEIGKHAAYYECLCNIGTINLIKGSAWTTLIN
ncbi:hypothetical protein [Tepidimicrobium xylanilyticum]|nr:hypothetical protein [Tepidimicrobium xylanilyticum]